MAVPLPKPWTASRCPSEINSQSYPSAWRISLITPNVVSSPIWHVWENRVRLASMALPTTWVQRSLLRKCQSRWFHHVGGMDDIKREAVRGGNKGTPTGAARQARTPQRFQLEPAHREHDSIEVIAPGKAPSGKTHNPTFPVSGLTTWG